MVAWIDTLGCGKDSGVGDADAASGSSLWRVVAGFASGVAPRRGPTM